MEKRQQKEAGRLENRGRREPGQEAAPGEDPDIAGIVPGPQPSPWGDDDLDEKDDDQDEEEDDEEPK
jgi:hypothetical protein